MPQASTTEDASRTPQQPRIVSDRSITRRIVIVLASLVVSLAALALMEPSLVGEPTPNYISSPAFDIGAYQEAFTAGPVCTEAGTTVLDGTVDCQAYDQRGGLPMALLALVVAALGAVLILRGAEALGWLLLLAAVADRLGAAAAAYATQAELVSPGSLPLGTPAAFIASVAWVPLMVVILPAIAMRVPKGTLPSPGWRWATRFTIVVASLIALVIAFSPVWMGSVPNPIRLSWSVEAADGLFGLLMLGMLGSWALGGLALVVRAVAALRRRTRD